MSLDRKRKGGVAFHVAPPAHLPIPRRLTPWPRAALAIIVASVALHGIWIALFGRMLRWW